MPPNRLVRLVAAFSVRAILGVVWLLAAAMFMTGLILWRDWRALARGGADHEARVKGCVFEVMHVTKNARSSGGFYSCDYEYRVGLSSPAFSGHFQSPRALQSGDAIAIRYLPHQPSLSASIRDLEHPSLAPAAMMLLPLVFAGLQCRAPLLRAIRSRIPRRASR